MVFSLSLYTRMHVYLTYLTYLTYGSLSEQGKPRQDKKGHQILSLKSFCQIIYTGQVYIHLTSNTSSLLHTLSPLHFLACKEFI